MIQKNTFSAALGSRSMQLLPRKRMLFFAHCDHAFEKHIATVLTLVSFPADGEVSRTVPFAARQCRRLAARDRHSRDTLSQMAVELEQEADLLDRAGAETK